MTCSPQRVIQLRARKEQAADMVDYNPFAEEVMKDPFPVYRRLRDEAPVYHIEEYDCWALSRFEDIWQATMDAENYSTAQGTTSAHLLTKVQPVTPMLNLMDPPQHTKLRASIRRFFTPGSVGRLAPQIEGFIEHAIENFRSKGECDAMSDFASQVAVKVACVANGFPIEDGDLLNGLVWRFFGREEGVDGMTQDGLAAMMELNEYFISLIQARRKKPAPEPTVVDTFLTAEVDGQLIADEAIASHLSLLIIGGAETFPKVFANLVLRLHEHPDQRARCAADPALVPDAFTEGLRIDMPTQFLCRTLVNDVELRGETMKKGRPVLFLYPSANRDDREFENPDTFDIERRPERILSFSHGIHACIGAHFARLEGKLCLEALLRHAPEYRIEVGALRRFRTEFVQGFEAMPIAFEPF